MRIRVRLPMEKLMNAARPTPLRPRCTAWLAAALACGIAFAAWAADAPAPAAGAPPAMPNPVAPAGSAPAATAAPAAAGPTAGSTSGAPGEAPAKPPAPESPYQPDRFAGKAWRYYAFAWGIDSLSVKRVESGELIRFTYRVLDPARAAPINDKRLKPALIDEVRGVSLVVPEMENIGMLRQTPYPQRNRSYWLVFSNKGRLVKRGDRVDVVIGPFRANNLVVD